jgi:hypothetical protein
MLLVSWKVFRWHWPQVKTRAEIYLVMNKS